MERQCDHCQPMSQPDPWGARVYTDDVTVAATDHQIPTLHPEVEVAEPSPPPAETVRALCHDMLQPLTTLRLMASDVRRHGGEQVMTAILGEVNWLATLVESVLDISAQTGPTVVELGELVTRATTGAFTVRRCHGSLDVDGPVWVHGRGFALERAVHCLLDNAIRAAGEGGHVHVVVSEHDGAGRVVVLDDGPGMGRLAPQHCLGLATVRAVLADCAGRFWLDNRREGGAIATLEVPLSACQVSL